ncbi:MAG: hypothetical protein ACC642_09045, partial [Pseudomonadales bacterium]
MGKRSDIDKAIRNLMNWADRPEWANEQVAVFDAHLGPVCNHHGMSQDELGQELADHGYGDMLYGMMFEDLATRRKTLDGDSLIDDYLKRRGWHESTGGRRYLQRLRDSVLSLYEVTQVAPGRHCDLRDLVRGGETIRVVERAGTEKLVKWDRIAARVLKGDRKHIFSGGILPFPLDPSQQLLKMLDNARRKVRKQFDQLARELAGEEAAKALTPEGLDHQFLESAVPMVVQVWLLHMLEHLHAPLPELLNRDGEQFLLTETWFPANARHHPNIAQRLDATNEWHRDARDAPFWTWLAGDVDASNQPDDGLSLEGLGAGGQPMLGNVELKADALVLTTNSTERTERGKQTLTALLEHLIGPPLSKLQTPEQLMAESLPTSRHKSKPSASDSIDPKVAAKIMHDYK